MMSVMVEAGVDAGAVWHLGDPNKEQRLMERAVDGDGTVVVDLSHRDVVQVSGPDRLSWLHDLTSQELRALPAGVGTTALLLSARGHIEHAMQLVDDGENTWIHTEPGAGEALAGFLDSMRFMLRVEVTQRTPDLAVIWSIGTPPASLPEHLITRSAADSLGGREAFVPRDHVADFLGHFDQQAGVWAYEARRIAAGVPRLGCETDHRTIPNELGLWGTHLEKGCYRGQETVARVHNLGRPPRRLVLLHLDGSVDELPAHGTEVFHEGKKIGFVGSAARHYELGPVALGVVRRGVPADAELLVGAELSAAQEPLVDPEVGLHIKPKL
ncbi:folate-binding protein YgfZ [Parenemella sanctibonifatiensis]|uniref:Folate-binding protein YgfZ n=2 Tax=Parenemella sanctibonifatiensis TaxID=2016505 RepID=A0A255E5L7_9ACTN|nr:folate-binding protein YgfZ [Parenemella sanctibonifatiensis]